MSKKKNVVTDELNNTIIEKEVEQELIWITMAKYALFMSYGKIGIDAKSLYEHYQFTSNLQKTGSIWALDTYCRQGLEWGRDRFEKAKNLLNDLGLIQEFSRRDEKGKFTGKYVKIKMGVTELEPARLSEKPQADLPTSGKTTTNAYSNKLNAYSNKVNTPKYSNEIQELFKTWLYLGLSQHKEEVVKREIKQAHVDSFKQFPLNIWKKMISDYQIVYDSSKYYYTHWFTFWDFIGRGYKQFLPEQKPLVNFLAKDYKQTTFRDQANSRYFNSLTEAEKKEYIEKRSKNKLLE